MEKIVEKIIKLLELSKNNQNEAEAYVAVLKAREIMAKHNISELVLKTKKRSSVAQKQVITPARAQWENWLFALICKNFRCQGFYRDKYPVFIGLQADISIAAAVFEYARSTAIRGANRMYRKVLKTHEGGVGIKPSYFRGFVVGLKKQFEQDAQARGNEMALALTIPPEVLEYTEKITHSLDERSFRSSAEGSMVAFQAGYRDGQRLPKPHQTIMKKGKN